MGSSRPGYIGEDKEEGSVRSSVFPILGGLIVSMGLVSGVFGGEIHENAGTTGMAFLKIGVGGRAAALSGAYTAVSDDPSAAYWNPAGLSAMEGKRLLLMHSAWFQDIQYEYAGYVVGNGHRGIGFYLAFQTSGELEYRVKPSKEPLGTFSVYDLAWGFSYGRRIRPDLEIGMTAKLLYEKIHTEGASGGACDIGALYRTPLPGLTLGLALRHLGGMGTMKSESMDLPAEIRMGTSYVLLGERLLIAADVSKPNDGWTRLHAGAEYRMGDLLALRVGYQTGSEEQKIAVGCGLHYGRWRMDYAFVPFYVDIGNTHRVSLDLGM